jgi:ATP-dependent DNA helicase RecG
MSHPSWVDEKLSHDLPNIRAQGESQQFEFIREFPQQVSDLAKEIAAFATSNTGTILLGVENNGDLIGLEGLEDPTSRDTLLRRLEGICCGAIKPAVIPRVSWAIETFNWLQSGYIGVFSIY